MAWSSTPKGFRNYSPSTPQKEGSHYTAGVFNSSLGTATGIENNTKRNRDGWLYYKTTPYDGTGKTFTIDFAFYGGTGYFNLTAPEICVDIRFYSSITGKLDSSWYKLSNEGFGDFRICNYQNSVAGLSKQLYENYRTFGTYKPAYGIVRVTGVDPADYPTYSAYCTAALDAGGSWYYWDSSSANYRSFVGKMPLGVRYISNSGRWGRTKTYPDANGVVRQNYQSHTSVSWSQNTLDDGNTPSNFKTFTITPDLIRRVHGTVTGVTAFQLRISVDRNFIWYFGCPNVSNPASGQGIYTMIDNPQLGLLDYGPRDAAVNWPPRYDAKAYIMTPTGKSELAAKYNPGGGEWSIF